MSKALYTNPEAPGIYTKNPFTVEDNVVSLQLTQGQVALCDLTDLPLLAAHRWHAHFHRNTFYGQTKMALGGGKHKLLKLHRLLQKTTPDRPFVDHRNGNGLDNRRDNLRASTSQENRRNATSHKNSASVFKGVYKKGAKWQAQIRVNGKLSNLGSFPTEIEAARAYDAAARALHGEFARLNFPE